MKESRNPEASGTTNRLPADIMEKVERMIAPSELRAALEKHAKPTLHKEEMPDISSTASAMECTGLMYAMPKDEEEYASYQELYDMEIPQKTEADAFDGGEHSARGRKILHGKETPRE